MATITQTGAEAVEWDLSDLYEGPDDPRFDADLQEARSAAEAFRERYRGRIGELSTAELLEATRELERIESIVDRAGTFAMLRFTADTSDPARGAVVQRAREQATAVETDLLFFGLEWAALPDEAADALLADDVIEHYRDALRAQRRYRPYLLSEPEERVDAEKNVTGASAWVRLFSELVADLTVRIDDQELALDQAVARLARLTEREDRRQTAEAITEALAPGLRTRGFILNTIANERAIEDRLRGYPSWVSARNLANRTSDEAVESLVQAIIARYDIPQRYYALKARLLGLDRLADYDRFAPLGVAPEQVPWEQARETVLEAYSAFSPEAGRVVSRFFDENWIDAPPRPGKTNGAFCASVADLHPYVLLNYSGEQRSVLTLAHELGHGLHGALSVHLGLLNMRTPLTLAETASVFGEALTFRLLLERETDPKRRLELLANRIEDTLATVFRQVGMNRFEHEVHTARRDQGELDVDRIAELWAQEQRRMVADTVELTDGYRSWWSYIPHFIQSPGYVYAYAYGYLFSLAIYRRYLDEGEALVEPILDLLRAGGSAPPDELARRIGFDVEDPGFWSAGLDAIAALVDEAEGLAGEVSQRR